MTTETVARCERAGVTFGRGATAVVAVHEATCTVERGDRIAVTGRSGSGKSTFLHMLSGLDVPTVGTVTWPAIGSVDDLRPGRVGLVFQAPSLLPSLDVEHNVALPMILDGRTAEEAAERARAALVRLGLGDLLTQMPEQLSGGQAQRVAVARTLAHEPTLILADEPTGQLDHDSARSVVDALLEAADRTDAALVVSTHDPEIAARLGRQWSITDGQLERGDRR